MTRLVDRLVRIGWFTLLYTVMGALTLTLLPVMRVNPYAIVVVQLGWVVVIGYTAYTVIQHANR